MPVTAINKFAKKLTTDINGPCYKAFAITKSDTDELPFVTRKIYVGGAGNIVVILAGDSSSVTLNSVPAGTVLEIMAKQILNATTATNLVGMY